MLKRKLTPREQRHLEKPAFLERYFQKKAVWMTTVLLFTPLVLWVVSSAFLDFTGMVHDPDFDIYTDLLILILAPFTIAFAIQEYFFYQKHIWSKQKKSTD